MSKQLCRFYNTGRGCNRGDQCRFVHSRDQQVGFPSLARNETSGNASSRPRNTCSFFWEEGRCNRGFDCRFEHIQKHAQHPSEGINGPSLQEKIAPFLSEKGLAKIHGKGTDRFFDHETSGSPSEVHNRLRRFLNDHFQLQKTFDVYAFVQLLASASVENRQWTQEDGQLLLSSIASRNGLLQIASILNWSEVSVRPPSYNREVLSFQRGILPLLRYLSSEFVVKSTLMTQANSLYTVILQNLDRFADIIERSMNSFMVARSFMPATDASTISQPIDTQIFASVAGVLHELLVRFKNATAIYPRLGPLVISLGHWFDEWCAAITSNPLSFGDPLGNFQPPVRELIVGSLRESITRLLSIVEREKQKSVRPDKKIMSSFYTPGPNDAVVAALHNSYEGPGHLRAVGPRHDNDFEDIYDIRIAPTNQELMSRLQPYLPGNFYEAPHHAPADSVERLLDIQFRLLREELTAPLRKAVQLVQDDLNAPNKKKTRLADVLQKKGGKYRGMIDAQESLMFNVYTGVQFVSLVPDWRGISITLLVDAPPGRARHDKPGMRVAFWESMSGKRLFQGGLIALVWEENGKVDVHLGIVASSVKDLTDYVRKDSERVSLRVVFFDTKVELRVLQALRTPRGSQSGFKLIVESPVMFEAIRPFLEALKIEPEILPFSRHLVHHPSRFFDTCTIDPPRYSRLPDFSFELDCLFDEEVEEGLTLSVSDPRSIERARERLRESRLDPSQADAVVDALTREVALIQGPPGTGKSYTGVELLRVLKANNIGPILMIAFTNHALDHMLSSVLDANITSNIIRLGSRSSDERISQYSIETLELVGSASRLDSTYFNRKKNLRSVQEEIKKLMNEVTKHEIDSAKVLHYLSAFYPEHYEYLQLPPLWISNLKKWSSNENAEDAGVWMVQGRNGQAIVQDSSNYAYWKDSRDLNFISSIVEGSYAPQNDASKNQATKTNAFSALSVDSIDDDVEEPYDDDDDDLESGQYKVEDSWKSARFELVVSISELPSVDVEKPKDIDSSSLHSPVSSKKKEFGPADFTDIKGFFTAIGCETSPQIPTSNRPLDKLLEDVGNVWTMSSAERACLHAYWADQARLDLVERQVDEFERLRERHSSLLQECKETKEEVHRNLLRDIDIIGCTTTGAAKLSTLLKGLSPRVLLVEEAGQVLEAHVVGSLVPSIEHLILIGDPLQLRPTLNNFCKLSQRSRRGREFYKFDMSLMERLSSSGFPMSHIDVQRRMRPTISSLIKNTLYPGLQDHELVKQYPAVRGIGRNIFFFNHDHKENDGEDSTSKYNTFEVQMIRDLVLYLLRQGCYSDDGDIIVLCAYLGQLARLRDALAGDVTIVIDERDKADLAYQEGDKEDTDTPSVSLEHVKVTKKVRIRTVDNFQGEEGRIVILSLVRNSGNLEDEMASLGLSNSAKATIGFLKSENRTNVALSRAKEGLYIFGNADNLVSRSQMWRHVIEELENGENVGPALPIICHQHPEAIEYVSEPGRLPQIAPDGGCLRKCNIRLKCGHLCPFKCHSDDPNHVTVYCSQPCRRLCPRGHPCSSQCSVPCRDCQFPVPDVELPCGHRKASVACYQLESLDSVLCEFMVEINLPNCGHTASLRCSDDPSTYRCDARCGGNLQCCGKSCNAQCYECHDKITASKEDVKHKPHSCQKSLFCQHLCREKCSTDHTHTDRCKEKCRQDCVHAQCRSPCSTPCAPCKEPCTWRCAHKSCPLPCGSVCVRLPCDEPCNKQLECGHRCPSVCGEDCDIQVCPECASDDIREQVVDFILNCTLGDVCPGAGMVQEDLLVTIPSCRHTFTLETLDGCMGMNEFYTREDGKWTGLCAPIGFVQQPVCPLCRAPVNTPRYGRIVKRALLDILERNVAAYMSRSIGQVQRAIQSLSTTEMKNTLVQEAASIAICPSKSKPPINRQKKARDRVLKESDTLAIPVKDQRLQCFNKDLFFIDSEVGRVWGKVTKPLFTAYKGALNISNTRSPHTNAWEAAFSYLYEGEIQEGLRHPAQMPRQPQHHAMRVAQMRLGQSRPLADKRFLVEAFWVTLQIRLNLVDLARTWLVEVSKRGGTPYPPFHRQQWGIYISFLLSTCLRDVDIADEVARASESYRQVVKCALFRMRIQFEQFHFNHLMCTLGRTLTQSKDRADLAEAAASHGHHAEKQMNDTIQLYFSKKNIASQENERLWIEENFSIQARAVADEWKEIERSIRYDTFYEPVTREEKIEIIEALNFSAIGHFYQCLNGHVYVITECGGAMERSVCPDCGAEIGGENHHLVGTNNRATEFDNLARSTRPGIPATPWQNPY